MSLHPRASFFAGVRSGLPIFAGYLPVGFVFGILARQHGFTPFEAIAASAAGFSGAGQFVALSTLTASGHVAAAIIASGIVNLRYVLFSASLSPFLKGSSLRSLLWPAFSVTDESFAVNTAELRNGTATLRSMSGVGAIAWCGWVVATALGAFGGAWVGDLSRFGVDFAMPAMYAALFVALAQNRRQVLCGFGTAVFALALAAASRLGMNIPAHWLIVVSALVGATLAVVVFPARTSDAAASAAALAYAERDEMLLAEGSQSYGKE
jgi:4-azaleucine resistance transporter AzlC